MIVLISELEMLRFMLAMNVVTVKEKTARGGKMCGGKMCEGKRKWNCVSIYGMIGMSCAACVPYVIRQLADKIA